MGRKYTHQTTRASLPPIPLPPPEDILANIPVIGINVQLNDITAENCIWADEIWAEE